MTKTSARKAFSDSQLVASLIETSNNILRNPDACKGAVTSNGQNSVIELSFAKYARLSLEIRARDYIAVVKSSADLPRDAVEKAAFNTHRSKDGSVVGSYEYNPREFSFESEDLQSLTRFVAAFAKAQRPNASQSVDAPAAPVAARVSTFQSRREAALQIAEREHNINQQSQRVAEGELVHVPGTDVCMTPNALAEFSAALNAEGLKMREPGTKAASVTQVLLPEVVIGNKTIANNSTHFVDVVPQRVSSAALAGANIAAPAVRTLQPA